MAIDRHKVFISFHSVDWRFKDYLINLSEYNFETHQYQSIFDDYSVGEGDIDDSHMSDEEVRIKIRDDFIKEATVLILLCGAHTNERKFIDWELHAAMFDTEKSPKLGILVINLPSIQGFNCIRSGQEDEKNLISYPGIEWFDLDSRKEYEDRFPYLPSRIIDNFESELTNKDIVPITIVDWDVIQNDTDKLKILIDNAFKRSRDKDKHYNHSAPLKSRNSRN